MNTSIKNFVLFIAFVFVCGPAVASHIVGADFSYTYNGDTLIGGTQYNIYTVSLSIFENCLEGQPEAIAQDNPAFLAIYNNPGGAVFQQIDSVFYSSAVLLPPVINASPCGATLSSLPVCLLKKTFIKRYILKPSTTGYIVAYQRCCRNNAIVNIVSPGDHGATFTCSIPPAPIVNNSAVFKNNPHQVICYNLPLFYDNSAYDPDGDSLSYGFCSSIDGANEANIKPIPTPPPYTPTEYASTYSGQQPFSNSGTIYVDPVTGIMTGKPNQKGRFLVTIVCYEWRGGVVIDSITREFQFIVTDCDDDIYKPYAGADTTVMVGDTVSFNALGGKTFSWTPGTFLNDPHIQNPVGHFTVPGYYTYTLHAVSDSGCEGTDVRNIWVIEHAMFVVPNAFSPNGDGRNDMLYPFPVYNATMVNFRVINREGNVVYSGGPGDPGWDGTYKGRKQNMGTFFWQVTYLDNEGIERKQVGNVTLVK